MFQRTFHYPLQYNGTAYQGILRSLHRKLYNLWGMHFKLRRR